MNLKRSKVILLVISLSAVNTACGSGGDPARDAAYDACFGNLTSGSSELVSKRQLDSAEYAADLDTQYMRLNQTLKAYKYAADEYQSYSTPPIPESIRGNLIVTLFDFNNECDVFFGEN